MSLENTELLRVTVGCGRILESSDVEGGLNTEGRWMTLGDPTEEKLLQEEWEGGQAGRERGAKPGGAPTEVPCREDIR
jgi:hypothetical protein